MKVEVKKAIVNAANEYMKEYILSQNEMARQTNINVGYLSPMLKGQTKVAETEIPDRWFVMLADFVGYELNKSYWKVRMTPQFEQVIAALNMAKANGTTCLLTGGSGCGKTYAIDKFLKKNPLHTYRIIINDYYKLNDVINELMKLLNIDLTPMANAKHTNGKGKKYRIDAIIERLRDIRLQGGTPMLIIDEGENMAIPMLKMIKALYDQLTSYCAIVILGTEDLIKLMQSRETLYPLYRRFKAGHKRLPAMDRQFDMFLTDTVADKGLRRLLCDLCNNYGELHDYLEPALREADEREVPLTEELFRIMNNIPKLRTA